jgi:hypothetical protein
MVTGVEFTTGGVTTGDRAGFVLRVSGGGIVMAEGYEINLGATGGVTGRAVFSTPIPMAGLPCLDRSAGTTSNGTRTWIRGFLAPNE